MFRSSRQAEGTPDTTPPPEPIPATPQPVAATRPVVTPTPQRKKRTTATLGIAGAIAACAAALAIWVATPDAAPPPEVEVAEAEPIARPALVDDLSSVAMPQADIVLGRTESAHLPGPQVETLARVSPGSAPLPETSASPDKAGFSDTRAVPVPPEPQADLDIARGSATGLAPPVAIAAPEIETTSAAQSFPLSADKVQDDVAETVPLEEGPVLDLASIPREFVLPPEQWPDAAGFSGLNAGLAPFVADPAPPAVPSPALPPTAVLPSAETEAPVEPTRAENDVVDGADGLAPALPLANLPPETAQEVEPPVSFAPLTATLTPRARPEAPEIVEVVTAVATSLRPQDRPAPRIARQTTAVAAASTAGIATQPAQTRTQSSNGSSGIAELVARPRTQPAPGTPSAVRVARAATDDDALQFGRVNLIGVFGSDGSRRALVRLSTGRMVRVSIGDRVDGGRVAAIGSSSMSYVKGGRTINLAIPSG